MTADALPVHPAVPPLDSPVVEPLADRPAEGQRLRGRDADGRRLQVDVFAGALRDEPARVFVHEDVVAAVEAVVPPRRVPWSRRLFWELVFVLMRHRPTRDWLLRRYSR